MDDAMLQRAVQAGAEFAVVRPGVPTIAKTGRRGQTVRYPVQLEHAIDPGVADFVTLVHLGEPLLEPDRLYLVGTIATSRFPDARQMLAFEVVEPEQVERASEQCLERVARERRKSERRSE